MKEIKFRYRFDRGDLVESVTGEPRYKFEIVPLSELEDGRFDNYYSNYKILSRDRFTGLKDKNGKEIYEGDIIRYPDTESEYVDVGIGGGGVKVAEQELTPFYPVEFKNGEFGITVTEETEVLYKNRWYSINQLLEEIEWVEIIGNIYENPELIK